MRENERQHQPRTYAADEVIRRLEDARKAGELHRDSRGVYHTPGASGTMMNASSGHHDLRTISRPPSPAAEIKQLKRRFSIKAFVREGVRDLKEFFRKKETKHE